MKKGLVKKQDLEKFLETLIKTYSVYAPVHGEKEPEFEKLTGKETVFPGKGKLPPKKIFFPQTEVILTFESDEVTAAEIPAEAIVVFGSRPCDARALTLLDKIFSPGTGGYKDPYYMERRAKSIIISLACSSFESSCFCTSVGGGPGDAAGSDVLLYDNGDSFILSGVTAKGEQFLETNSSFLNEVADEDYIFAKKAVEAAEAEIPVFTLEKDHIKESMEAKFDAPQWADISRNCISCGVCTYLCPTCHCFDITDDQRMGKGKRVKTWDSCQYPMFTKHASGHNPRKNKSERLRQRFMHKFVYTQENTEEVFCVGCGRCITYCPVNVDIREVIGIFSQGA